MRVDWYDAIRVARSDRRKAALILAVAAAMAGAVFVLREGVTDQSSAVLVLLVIPVAVIAVFFGRWPGLAAAAVAEALVGIYHATGSSIDVLGYVTRGTAFLLLGFGIGAFSDYTLDNQRRMRTLLDGTLDAVTVGRPLRNATGGIVDITITYVNAVAVGFLGRDRADILGRRWSELWPSNFSPDLLAGLVGVMRGEPPIELSEVDVSVDQPSGTIRLLVDLRVSAYDGGIMIAWREVSARLRDARAVAVANARFAAAFDHAPLGMLLVGPDRRIVRANPTFGALCGRGLDALPGMNLDDLYDPRDVPHAQAEFTRLMTGETTAFFGQRRLLNADGTKRWVSVSASRFSDTLGDYAVEHIEDISERKALEARLQHLADHDPLTGLFNRRRFNEEVGHQAALDARYRSSSVIAVIDLDNFKDINDTLGHAAGDQLIQTIAHNLDHRLRATDVLGRLGGDEFGLLLPLAEDVKPDTVVEALLTAIAGSEIVVNGQRVRCTASIGIATLDGEGGTDPETTLANADLAMYAAKEAGRDTFVVYDPSGPHATRARARFRWLDRIRRALDEDLFVLHAQPLLDLTTNEITGCELLLRMREDDQVIPPEPWLYIADRHGLAPAIDRYVIHHGIELAASHPRPPGFRWEINLSAESLGDPDIPQLIATELRRTGLPPATLVFEITETAVIANMSQAIEFATQVNELGCRFALDDFGAGYGSFYYLKHLPFDYLKIDGEFIRHLTVSSTDQVIVQAIVTAAHRLGIETIAEYVGDAPTLDLLRRFHVDHAQGYHVGRPADPVKITP